MSIKNRSRTFTEIVMVNRTTGKKEKADKLTALLSLSATGNEAETPCLTAEEMATLIDNHHSEEVLSRFQHHLSSCDTCYQEWLFLKKMQQSPVTRGRIYRLSGSRRRKLAGTALAIAASIAVFLNIPQEQDTIFEQPTSTQDTAPQEKIQVPDHLKKTKAQKDENLFSPDNESILQENQADERKEIIDMQAPSKSEEEVHKPTERMRAKTLAAGRTAAPAPPTYEITALDQWLNELKEQCSSGPHPSSFWHSVRSQGEHLLQSQTPEVSEDRRTKTRKLLELLSQIKDDDSATSQCLKIRSQLAEDEKSM